MAKYTLKCEHKDYYSDEVEQTITLEFEKDTLDGVLESIEYFLKGSGFHFEGSLDIVNLDTYKPEDELLKDSVLKEEDYIYIKGNSDSTEWPFPSGASDFLYNDDNMSTTSDYIIKDNVTMTIK